MEKVEILVDEYNSLKKAKADKKLLEEQNKELSEKNKELGENIVKQKDSLKEKHKKELLDLTTKNTELETNLKKFTEKLEIGEDEKDIDSVLENITSDLGNYKQIKEKQEETKKANITKYTDFINSTNKEGEDFLKSQVEIFGQDVLQNEKALEGFAKAKGFKESGEETNKSIKVGEFTPGEKPTDYNSFNEAEQKGDFEGMTNSFFGKV